MEADAGSTHHAPRRALWLAGALSALVLGIVLQVARVSDPTPAFLVGSLAQLVILATVWRVIRGRARWPASIHTDARWSVLDLLRALASVTLFAAVVLAAVAFVLSSALDVRVVWLAFASALVAALGWILERPAHKARPDMHARRAVYRTPTGAVVASASGDAGDIRLTGRSGVHRLSDVQRAIDARGWKDAHEPTPRSLRAALARWGTITEEEP